MAISEPNANRMKLESEEEVCIILEGASIYSFLLYIVDLNEKPGPSMKLLEPFFRCSIKFPYSGAYVMLNSVLYRFGGYSGGEWTSKSWRFDLKPYFDKVSSCDSSLDSGTEISGMTSKCEPCAVVVGDRICVFSLSLLRNLHNFELYNPKDGKWSPLPELPCTLPTQVNYYAVEKDDLLIHTSLGSYSITIDEQWKPYSNDTNRPLETPDVDGPSGYGSGSHSTNTSRLKSWIARDLPRVDGPDGYGSVDTNNPRQWKPCELPEVDVDEGCGLAKKGDLLISPCLDVVDIAKPNGEPYSFWKLQNDEGCLPSSEGFIPSHQAVVPLLDKHGLRTCTVEVGGNGYDFYGTYDLLLRLTLVRFGERPCEGDNMLLNIRLYELAHDFFNNLAIVKGIYPLRNFISGS